MKLVIMHHSSLLAITISITPIADHGHNNNDNNNDNNDNNQHSLSLSSSTESKMMSVLLPPLGQDSPMFIEHLAPANQFHSQNTNTPLQSTHNDHCSVTTDGSGDSDGNVKMCLLNDRQPLSSVCTLFLVLVYNSFILGTLGDWARLRIYIWHRSPGAPGALTELLHHPMTSQLLPFRSVPIVHNHDTSSQTGKVVSSKKGCHIVHADLDLKILKQLKQLTAKGASRN